MNKTFVPREILFEINRADVFLSLFTDSPPSAANILRWADLSQH